MGDNTNNNGIPNSLRLVVRAWGACSALCCAALGFFVLFTLSATCFGIGIHMICVGILVLMFEAPICCQYIPVLITVSNWIESHFKFWMRGTIYFFSKFRKIIIEFLVGQFISVNGFGFIPIIFCLEASTFIGGGSVVITSAMYGVLAIGRKGAANRQQSEDIEMKTNLVDNKGNPAADSESGP